MTELNMQTLYKYYSSNFDLENYLKDPTIRITQLLSLNDPFEGMITDSIFDIVSPKLQQHISPEIPITKDSLDYVKIHINNTVNSYGICSLSETNRNLLMWAHYASEHKGYCIGYNAEMLKWKNKKINGEANEHFRLRKVNYDSVIFDDEHLENAKNIQIVKEDSLADIMERCLTTKSNDWLYEKEHRYIGYLASCERIIVLKKASELTLYMKRAISRANGEESHDVIYGEKNVILNTKRDSMSAEEALLELETIEFELSKSKDVLFLTKIKKSDIKYIYFGCNSDVRKIHAVMEVIRSDKELQHIKVYNYSLSTEKHELKANKIAVQYIPEGL